MTVVLMKNGANYNKTSSILVGNYIKEHSRRMKIVIVNHTFAKTIMQKRWRELASSNRDWDVYLLAPTEWVYGGDRELTFGGLEKSYGRNLDFENFHVRLFLMVEHKYITWTSPDMLNIIKSINPNVIYHIGFHLQESLQQLISYVAKHREVMLLAFSMRGPHHELNSRFRNSVSNPIRKILRKINYSYSKYKLQRMNKYCYAIFCHYPDARKSFINEGFSRNIFLQTQVGVDMEQFFPDRKKGIKIREKYGIRSNEYLFISAVRFNKSKGIIDILNSLPLKGNWKYLVCGWGLSDEVDAVKDTIRKNHLDDKVILAGFIDREMMPDYWNAADCAIHFPRTTHEWVETFSLSVAQAMAVGLPVVGSSSGSVPFQVGNEGLIVAEEDMFGLRELLTKMEQDREFGRLIGKRMYKRSYNFSTSHLNELFVDTVNSLLNDFVNKDGEVTNNV